MAKTPPAEPAMRHSRLRGVQAAAGLAVVLVALVLGTHLGGRPSGQVVADVGTVLAAALAAGACLHAGLRSRHRTRGFWLLLAAGSACWAAAEATWGMYELVLDQAVLAPSWADLGYLAAVPFVVAAFLVHPAAPSTGTGRGRAALDALSVATAVSFLAWAVVLGPLWRDSDLSTAAGLVAVAYPFTDVVLLVLVVLTISRADAANRASLYWVLTGLAAMALVDSGYTFLAQAGQYQTGDVIDVGWLVAYLALALGAYGSERSPAPVPVVEVATAPFGNPPSLLAAVAPFLPVLLALGATPLVVHTDAGLDGPARAMALGLVVLVLARQGLHLYDRRPRLSGAAVA